ncbi:MAG TPA: flagellar basal body L-ring protein FlgH [Pseudogulbenkiania sp.]|nr:flagellar basal body L-ring protein FlgH [Pseudogulbenkiania sp.]
MKAYFGVMAMLTLALTGCAVPEQPIVHQPMSARPQPAPMALPGNGSIFQTGSYQPIFSDRVPARVGDTLTVTIQEKTTTAASEQTTGGRSASLSNSMGAGLNLPFLPNSLMNNLAGANLSANGAEKSAGKGTNQASSSFVSSVSVTVIEVLANGNLMVSGEKQVRFNGDTEYIRLSGVVNPRDIAPGNIVSSTKVADARIEQESKGNNRLFAEPGWLTKFFMSVLPF